MRRAWAIAFVLAACGKSEPRKVHGWVVEDSITQTTIVAGESQRDFTIEEKGVQTRVRTHGPPPDTFKNAAEIEATCADAPKDLCDATDYRVVPPQF